MTDTLEAPPARPGDPLDLDAEYNNRERVPEWAEILARYENEASAFRASHGASEVGAPYDSHPRQTIDIFPVPGADTRPLVVFIHGGYWRSLHPSNFSHFAAGLNQRGYAVAMPAYRLCPEVSVADIVEDLRAACLFLHKRFAVPLIICGWSAGGHLAACMSATDWRTSGASDQFVKAGLAIAGLFELKPLLRTTINETLRLDEASANSSSPVFWTPTATTFESVVGETESPEFHRQCRLIAARWAGAIPTASRIIPATNHFTAPEGLATPDSPLVETLVGLCRRA